MLYIELAVELVCAVLMSLLTALMVLVGCMAYDSYVIEQQVDPSNQLEVVRYIDPTHRIVSYGGKQYFQSRSYSTWVIGGEYKECAEKNKVVK